MRRSSGKLAVFLLAASAILFAVTILALVAYAACQPLYPRLAASHCLTLLWSLNAGSAALFASTLVWIARMRRMRDRDRCESTLSRPGSGNSR